MATEEIDDEALLRITKIVNGGDNSLPEREKLFKNPGIYEMKLKINLLALLLSTPSFCSAEYFNTNKGITIRNEILQEKCHLKNTEILAESSTVLIKSNENLYKFQIEDESDNTSIIVSDMTGDKLCDLAIPYARNDVNESYKVVLQDIDGGFHESRIQAITNPEFKPKEIISSYRDAARWHKDKFCYSENLKDFYLCKRTTTIDSDLYKEEICNETSCKNTRIFKKTNSQPATAIINVEKSYFHNKEGHNGLSKRKGYLIKNDEVILLDYYQSDSGFYFYVNYKNKTNGWINEEDLNLIW